MPHRYTLYGCRTARYTSVSCSILVCLDSDRSFFATLFLLTVAGVVDVLLFQTLYSQSSFSFSTGFDFTKLSEKSVIFRFDFLEVVLMDESCGRGRVLSDAQWKRVG